MSAEETAKEIAANGVSETTIAGRTTKFIDPLKALEVQDRLDRRAFSRRTGRPAMAFVPLTMRGTQD